MSGANSGPDRARLNLDGEPNPSTGLGAWIAADGTDPWIAVNFRGRPVITGIITQGRQDAAMWTTKYQVYYSDNAEGLPTTWTPVLDANENTAVSRLQEILEGYSQIQASSF